MSTQEPIKWVISWSNFNGWVSLDEYYWNQNEFFDSWNIQTDRYNAKVNYSNKLIYDFNEPIRSIFVNTWWSDNVLMNTSSWKIYSYTSWTPILKHTLANWLSCKAVSYMYVSGVKYIYFFHNSWSVLDNYIHKFQTDWTYVTSFTYAASVFSWWVTPTDPIKCFTELDRIFFIRYNRLYSLDNTETITLVKEFPDWENIVWLTNFLWEYKIYTSDSGKNSKMYKWNWWIGTSLQITPEVRIPWVSINNVVNDKWVDLFIWDNVLYQMSWVQAQKIKENINWDLLININWFTYWSWISIRWSKECYTLYKVWNRPWLPFGINSVSLLDTDNLITNINWIYCIDFWTDNIYYACWDSLFINTSTITEKTTNSWIVSLKLPWKSILEEKSVDYIILKFSNTDINNTISLYARTDSNSTWNLLTNTYNKDNDEKYWIKLYPKDFVTDIWNFHQIQFKVEFDTKWQKQPEFYWVELIYNINVWV